MWGAVVKCGKLHGLKVIPGMEVASREEVHLVCLLNTVDNALELQQIVYAALPNAAEPARLLRNASS